MNQFLGFGLPGGSEWFILVLLVLLFFGAKKLPELARGIGKSLGEFKRGKDEFESELKNSMQDNTAATPKPTPAPGQVSASQAEPKV
jgi:sec-independent protein translocase protein TatA